MSLLTLNVEDCMMDISPVIIKEESKEEPSSDNQANYLNSNFEYIKLLSQSLYGNVHLMFDQLNRCYVVNKVSNKHKAIHKQYGNNNIAEDVIKEAHILYYIQTYKLKIKGISEYIGFIETYNDYNTITKYHEGVELIEFISDFKDKNNNRMILENEIRIIFKQLIETVANLHSYGIIHGDLSCENIMIDSKYTVTLIDFGVAQMHHITCNAMNVDSKLVSCQENIAENTTLKKFKFNPSTLSFGKTGYISPEQYQGLPFDGYKNDIFALGQILFTLSTFNNCYLIPDNTDKWFKVMISGNWLKSSSIKNGEYGKRYNHLSDNLLDLINRLIKFEKDRITIDEILLHPWWGVEGLRPFQSSNT